jgi:hypothetical protein
VIFSKNVLSEERIIVLFIFSLPKLLKVNFFLFSIGFTQKTFFQQTEIINSTFAFTSTHDFDIPKISFEKIPELG